MKKHVMFMLAISFCLSFAAQSYSQTREVSFSSGMRINPGARFEYMSRKVAWGDEKYVLNLKTTIFALNLEIEINEGFSISGIAGYVLSDYDAITFRKLPFSIELNAADMGGYILGAEMNKSLFHGNDFEFGLLGQFLYHIGKEKTWEVPDLNVSGTVTGKPTWMRASGGAYVKFTGIESFSPYLAVSYNNLWGKFKMNRGKKASGQRAGRHHAGKHSVPKRSFFS
jgi:hypothetical protein